jgi:hypothetical protein
LELFATATFDQCAAEEVIDHLMALAVTDGAHEAGDPRAWIRLAEGDAAFFEKVEDELKVLKFLDGDGVEFIDFGEKVAILFQREGGGGGLALKMGVVNKNLGEMAQDFWEPIGGDFLAEQEHI